ncbi:MAG: CehA/McbA family metallohydrolase [Verrucomicrobia bacterium]|nr:CehA/McbA family metallohydrolase [Verrucomicrobiota bacterium]MDA1069097.1 CehA/McbA family metallohydrolase [Verrucomicrobiota bacterium]
MNRTSLIQVIFIFGICIHGLTISMAQELFEIRGRAVDSDSGEILPVRLYMESEAGDFFHADSSSPDGKAIPYSKIRNSGSVEVHTTLSAHPFVAKLPVGEYTVSAERGKEYLTASKQIVVSGDEEPEEITLSLKRWINMAERGWYSGETHVHRTVEELPTLMLAEDLNVAFPLTAWVTDTQATPNLNSKNPDPVPPAKLIEVDSTHVIWPVNTEYEIFTVNGNRHVLGAVFILNHKEALELAAPPVGPIADEARRQGGILELDKHNWPWSMMLVPVMDVGLYELTNNHIWRTQFQFKTWYSENVGEYMKIEMEDGGFTERGWIDFGFKNYYALLNCGFDLKPTAGTASGVHPVPLGFGRVYVKVDGVFSYKKWLDGLLGGRSFVTTGPMLEVEYKREGDIIIASVNYEFDHTPDGSPIELIVNGRPRVSTTPQGHIEHSRKFEFQMNFELEQSSWMAVRVIETKRSRFAHSAPVFFDVPGKPLKPRPEEVAYLIKRVEDEILRHQGVLGERALSEYHQALEYYRGLLD